MSLNKAKEAAQVNSMNKEQEIKQYDVKGGGDAEGKLVVGGEYNDDVAGGKIKRVSFFSYCPVLS